MLLPASAIAGVLLWRRRPWGYVLAGLLLVKTTASGLTLLAGTALTMRWNRPVDLGQTIGYLIVAAGGLHFTMRFLGAIRTRRLAWSPTEPARFVNSENSSQRG